MAQDFNEYLAIHVLNEQQYVSYRNLSRALKVHSNLAKQMLFEFHRKQNSKNLNSVHATYLITGTKKAAQPNDGTHTQEDGEDTVMRSSPPFPSSSMPQPDDDEPAETIATRTIMLVKEENLNKARELFENIAGMHIYSLQANSPKDFHVLAGCNRRVAAEYASEDPLKDWKQYGVIQNQDVKRRTGKRSPPAPTTASKPEPVKPKATAAAAVKSSKAEINSALKPSAKNATTQQSNSMTTKATATKKQESSILKSFAKGTAKSKKSDSQQSSTATSPAPAPALEDVPMTGFSEDEDEDGDSGLPENLDAIKAPSGKSKKDRAAELEAMMDQEDEPMEDAATPKTEQDDGAIDRVNSQATYEPKETVAVENGKRRGRRRVMKKKTVKDEEGYLVTREEAAWESFSEDEPAPKKAKVQALASTKAAGKKGAQAGKGNIMSFFPKK